MRYIPVSHKEPLSEGKVPKHYGIHNGKLCEIVYEPQDLIHDDPFDGQTGETDTYYLSGREEYWGFETVCKSCGTSFQAYSSGGGSIRNFCPGCGMVLETINGGNNGKDSSNSQTKRKPIFPFPSDL